MPWVDVLELGAQQQQQKLESEVSTQDTVHHRCLTRKSVIWRWRLRMVVRVHDQKSGCRHKVLLVHSTLSTTCQRLDHVDVLVIKRQSVPAGRPQGVEAPVQTAGSRHYVSDSSASVMKYKRVKNGAGTYRQAVSLVYTCIY